MPTTKTLRLNTIDGLIGPRKWLAVELFYATVCRKSVIESCQVAVNVGETHRKVRGLLPVPAAHKQRSLGENHKYLGGPKDKSESSGMCQW